MLNTFLEQSRILIFEGLDVTTSDLVSGSECEMLTRLPEEVDEIVRVWSPG